MESASTHPLECGFCRNSNPPDSRYCNRCGASLAAEPCPQCGAVNDVMANTCQKCEAPLADSQPDDFFLPLPPAAPAGPRSPIQLIERATQPDPARRDTPNDDWLPRTAPSAIAGSDAAAPCPHCGALNDDGATTCQKCEAPLADSPPTEFFLPLPPAAPATAESPLPATESVAEPDSDRRDTPVDDGLPPTAPSASAGSGASQESVASSPRRASSSPTAALVIAVLAVSAYFAYRHFQQFQPRDAAPRPVSTGEAKDGNIAAAPSKPITAPAAATPTTTSAKPDVGADLPPAVPATDRGASAASQAKATGGDDAGAKGDQIKDLFGVGPARPQAPTDTAMKPNPEQPPGPGQIQEAPKASAAGTDRDVRRPSSKVGGGAVQRPASQGPCTDALAALGLCTQENTQGRKP